MSRDHASAEERFRCLYTKHVDPIRGFAMRRADQADDAADIVADLPGGLATDRRGAWPGLIASSAGPGTALAACRLGDRRKCHSTSRNLAC
jgi:hypothetical protein